MLVRELEEGRFRQRDHRTSTGLHAEDSMLDHPQVGCQVERCRETPSCMGSPNKVQAVVIVCVVA
jgi:hypothetical protein